MKVGPHPLREGAMRFLLILALFVSSAFAADNPNIVVILADDYGYGSAGCYGADGRLVQTPNIDRLFGIVLLPKVSSVLACWGHDVGTSFPGGDVLIHVFNEICLNQSWSLGRRPIENRVLTCRDIHCVEVEAVAVIIKATIEYHQITWDAASSPP